MDRYRLKNIIILILVLMDVFLTAALVMQENTRRSAGRTAADQLVSLFAADGITLSPEMISKEAPPAGRTLSQDTALEQQVAAMLLGPSAVRSDRGGGLSAYTSSKGAALFRPGSFSADGTLADHDAEDFCRRFCREFGYESPTFSADALGRSTATVRRIFEQYPVFNGSVTFTVENDTLISLSGTLLPESYTELPAEVQPLSAMAALVAFQENRRQTIAVASSVTGLYCCFEVQSSASAPMTLVPSWCVETDTESYYINCITGAVSAG